VVKQFLNEEEEEINQKNYIGEYETRNLSIVLER